jgi:hypothetical protein
VNEDGSQLLGRENSFAPWHLLLQLLSMLCVGSTSKACIRSLSMYAAIEMASLC